MSWLGREVGRGNMIKIYASVCCVLFWFAFYFALILGVCLSFKEKVYRFGERGGEKDVGGIEEEETVIRVYGMEKDSISNELES